jgi:DNA polymerase
MIFLDFETRSTVNLANAGAWIYSKDPGTSILLFAYCTENSEIKLHETLYNQTLPIKIEKAIKNGDSFVAHYARFEYLIWRFICVPKFNWPMIPLKQWVDTMALASQNGLPKGLDECAKALGIGEKDNPGYRLMLKMSKPRKATKTNKDLYYFNDDMYKALGQYCKKDVELERKLFQLLQWRNEKEKRIWQINQVMNNTGLKIDKKAVVNSLKIIKKAESEAKENILRLTKGKIKSPNQCKAIAKFCKVKSVAKLELEKALKETKGRRKKVLLIRKNNSQSSTKKLKAMLARLDTDNRMRDLLIYHGASTGRETGNGPQPLNFPRGKLKYPEALKAIKRIRKGKSIKNPMTTISNCLRGFIIADKGKIFICADYSAIEARLVFWLAGEEKALRAFRNNEDIYIKMAHSIYSAEEKNVSKDQRYIGKQTILGLGYGMGAKKFVFNCYQKSDGEVKITERFAKRVVDLYREEFPKIKKLWNGIENAARNTIGSKRDHTFNGIKYSIRGNTLVCRLLSGRELVYQMPELQTEGWGLDKITYYGFNSQARKSFKWSKQYIWGGALVENIIQATARDLLCNAVIALQEKGYNVILTIYDEILIEQPKPISKTALNDVIATMTALPAWAKGLPIQAEGWTGKRYRKG